MGTPPIAGIEGLNVDTYADFRAGRVTESNLTEMRNEELLIANNIVILADKMPAKRPGYTLVNTVSGKVLAQFDFQRDYDQKQYLVVNSAGKISVLDVHGTGGVTVLSSSEDPAKSYEFVPTFFALYMSNGLKAQVLLDNAGIPTLYKWGISAPTVAPSVSLAAGTLTTQYGQQYAYCYVRKVTDGTGVTRMHIGPPSPLSASTGPLTSQMVNVSAFAAPPDATWNFIWIFRTNDTPANSTSALFFLAEISVGTVTYGDAITDTFLDLTRPVPYDNFPPSPAGIIVEYQSRIVGCEGNTVQASGLEEIILGLPQEAFPGALFFQIPGGKSKMSGAKVFDETLYLCTKDFWWTITGYDVTTFKKRDKIMQPGAVGKKAICVTPTHLLFTGRDKKHYAWDGVGPRPIEVSAKLAKKLLGTLSMEDINSTDIENAELRWYSDGRFSYVISLVNSGAAPVNQFDWIQLWNSKFLGETLQDGSTVMLSETDFFPSDIMCSSAIVEVDLKTYVFLGDANGNIYRWPDGFLDNGKPFTPGMGGIWSAGNVYIGPMFHPLPKPEVVKRYFWLDLQTDRQDAVSSFQVEALAADTPDMTKRAINIPLQALPGSNGIMSLTAARASLLQTPGCTVGRWMRFFVVFPADNAGATLMRVSVSARPVYGVAP